MLDSVPLNMVLLAKCVEVKLVPTYNPILTKLNINETKRYAGLKNSDFSDELLTLATSEARIFATPKAIWQVYPYEADIATITSPIPLALEGSSIKTHLASSIYTAVLSVTIGPLLETQVQNYFSKGEYTKGLLLDAAGSTAVEAAADQAQLFIAQEAGKLGCEVTSRFSPGYGDWNITVQSDILSLADAQEIGVTATESAMLLPRKSITALIGFVPHHTGITPLTTACLHDNCVSCKQINCLARKEN